VVVWRLGRQFVLVARAPPARTSEVFFPPDCLSIAGTLYLPADTGRHPAVIMVHGSGVVTGG
jgi:acetyl esterase/lipase